MLRCSGVSSSTCSNDGAAGLEGGVDRRKVGESKKVKVKLFASNYIDLGTRQDAATKMLES